MNCAKQKKNQVFQKTKDFKNEKGANRSFFVKN